MNLGMGDLIGATLTCKVRLIETACLTGPAFTGTQKTVRNSLVCPVLQLDEFTNQLDTMSRACCGGSSSLNLTAQVGWRSALTTSVAPQNRKREKTHV